MPEIITGFHAIEELIKGCKIKGKLLLSGNSKRVTALKKTALKAGVPVAMTEPLKMDKLYGYLQHRGAVLILTEKKESTQKNLSVFLKSYTKKDALVIVLDKITDPHNYGAILRSADQFYADLIIIPGRQSAQDSPTVLKTSAGASNYVPVVIHNIASAISMLKENGFWIFGAGLDGDRIDKKDFKGRVAVVLGSEGKGISSLVKKSCDTLISIPTSGNIDSLNVSVAAGIIMYEVRKQQTDKIV